MNRAGEDLSLADDLLVGASAIAWFMWGKRGDPRRVQRLARMGELPTFTIAGRLHARKSDIKKFIDERVAATRSRSSS